jgi:hypothetical protein
LKAVLLGSVVSSQKMFAVLVAFFDVRNWQWLTGT